MKGLDAYLRDKGSLAVPQAQLIQRRSEAIALANSGQRYLDASTAMFAVAGAAGLTSIVLAILTRWTGSEATRVTPSSSVT